MTYYNPGKYYPPLWRCGDGFGLVMQLPSVGQTSNAREIALWMDRSFWWHCIVGGTSGALIQNSALNVSISLPIPCLVQCLPNGGRVQGRPFRQHRIYPLAFDVASTHFTLSGGYNPAQLEATIAWMASKGSLAGSLVVQSTLLNTYPYCQARIRQLPLRGPTRWSTS